MHNKVMYLDESGDHSLEKIDEQYPIFVLGGAIFEKKYADFDLCREINGFKKDFFDNENLILHTADICRNRNGFEVLRNVDKRKKFYEHINSLMEKLNYKVVACVIQKKRHYEEYGEYAFDPYHFSLQILIERFCYEMTKSETGIIIAESRHPSLDKKLQNEWERIKIQGTKHIRPSEIRKKIVDFQLKTKNHNVAGLQVADLIVSPVGRYVLEKNNRKDFEIIERKFRRKDCGKFIGVGLVILPKT